MIHNKYNDMQINLKILGTGCSKCKTLEKVTTEVVKESNFDADIQKVEDIVNGLLISGEDPAKDYVKRLYNNGKELQEKMFFQRKNTFVPQTYVSGNYAINSIFYQCT